MSLRCGESPINNQHKVFFRSIAIIFLCYFLTACTSLLFQPVKKHNPLPAQFNTQLQDFYFSSQDGTKLHGWYLPSQQNPLKPKKTILYLHGNAINISSHLGGVYWLPEQGYEVYIFDYRGYGKSDGIAFLEGILADIDAAIHYVANQREADKKFIVMGHSIGASMGIYVISQCEKKNQIESFIAVSAFSDYRTITRDFLSRNWFTWLLQWPLSLTINNDYRPLDYVSSLSPVPAIFLHGKGDTIIEPHHTLALYEAAQQPKSISFLRSNHNDIFSYLENREVILGYLESNDNALFSHH